VLGEVLTTEPVPNFLRFVFAHWKYLKGVRLSDLSFCRQEGWM
jgi:hypothetical protein